MLIPAILLIAMRPQPFNPVDDGQAPARPSLTSRAIERVQSAMGYPDATVQELERRLTTADLHYVERLSSDNDREIALVTLLSERAPKLGDPRKRARRIGLGLAFLAAELAAGGESTGYSERSYTLGSEVPNGVNRRRPALNAMAWAARLGICPAAFVGGLQRLPLNQVLADGSQEPDLRGTIGDLGSAAYDLLPCPSTQVETVPTSITRK